MADTTNKTKIKDITIMEVEVAMEVVDMTTMEVGMITMEEDIMEVEVDMEDVDMTIMVVEMIWKCNNL
jgi:hypothetical protein